MDKKEFVMNAIGSNGFQSTATAAGYINPEIWNKQVLAFLEQNLVVTPLGKVYNDLLGAPGDTLNITINSTKTLKMIMSMICQRVLKIHWLVCTIVCWMEF